MKNSLKKHEKTMKTPHENPIKNDRVNGHEIRKESLILP
jgi:hypothetical protein